MQRRNFKCVPVKAKTLGDHIRLKRLEKGLTQGKVVKILGIPMKRLSDWERDLAAPSEAEWLRLASLLGLDGWLATRPICDWLRQHSGAVTSIDTLTEKRTRPC